ncbi:hypothetical protein L207DRAFT_6176 [Hyaloscypha variabilis F]|uniref:Secreted protein n=1 Tax=Hyaloscypha variabilis (strain UAMH 11265 / GT02V1 / F) TaxID=1149755 RepID=A0A2J6SC79_HYAVF|nr:hypothetical protein L207DRAFT_6176 [Hyaloscypha variabilis F]
MASGCCHTTERAPLLQICFLVLVVSRCNFDHRRKTISCGDNVPLKEQLSSVEGYSIHLTLLLQLRANSAPVHGHKLY